MSIRGWCAETGEPAIKRRSNLRSRRRRLQLDRLRRRLPAAAASPPAAPANVFSWTVARNFGSRPSCLMRSMPSSTATWRSVIAPQQRWKATMSA